MQPVQSVLRWQRVGMVALGAFVFIVLLLTRLYSYLLFHSLTEVIAIVVFFSFFVIAWNAWHYLENDHLLLLGIAYLPVAGLDTLHMLAYPGMGVIENSNANLSTSLWVVARTLQGLAWLIAPIWINRRLKRWPALIGAIAASFLAGFLVFRGYFPAMYGPDGLTLFKIVSEYVIVAFMLGGAWLLWRSRQAFDPTILKLLLLSIAFTVLSELSFTIYYSATDVFTLVGHILKVVAVVFLFQSVVVYGIQRPFDLLFHDLKLKEQNLRANQKQLLHQATHDPGTGLPNRALFIDRLNLAIEQTRREQHDGSPKSVGVFLLDLDDFKRINDSRGHAIGDATLNIVADRLRSAVRRSDTVARFGGDEFAVVATGLSSKADADLIGKKILEAVSIPFVVESQREEVHTSVGISLFPDDAGDDESLLRCADLALYAAKRRRNSAYRYSVNDPLIKDISREMGMLEHTGIPNR